ncbi:hypothetical protein ACPYIV_14090 [Parabacteroides sp. ASD2025]|uniref:hypothetical protein n=1 Tax=Parabacteroides sp. ASD2025 TaxID=3415987 RepID=UPI003CF46AED
MKKVLFIMTLMLIAACQCFGQTYFYKLDYFVDDNGIKSKGDGRTMYVTFINGRKMCYQSDKSGNIYLRSNGFNLVKVNEMVLKKTNSKGIHIYEELCKSWGNYDIFSEEYGKYWAAKTNGFTSYHFSNDFSRLNIVSEVRPSGLKDDTLVWVRISEESEGEDIDMY